MRTASLADLECNFPPQPIPCLRAGNQPFSGRLGPDVVPARGGRVHIARPANRWLADGDAVRGHAARLDLRADARRGVGEIYQPARAPALVDLTATLYSLFQVEPPPGLDGQPVF